jgi:hypothetical protein
LGLLTAVLATERITTTVIRGGRLGAGHGRPAGMSESHAETSRIIFSAVFKTTQKVEVVFLMFCCES